MRSKKLRLAVGAIFCLLVGSVQSFPDAGQVNPVPEIDLPLVPAAALPGGSSFQLTVTGAGFVPGSVVDFDGSARTTSFVSAHKLIATILDSDIAIRGTAIVRVTNPRPGGGISNAVFFQITGPTNAVSLSSTNYPTGELPGAVAAADFNGDGRLDLAVSNKASNTVSILLANGDGTFQSQAVYATGSEPVSLTAGDFNGDGIPDVAIVNAGSSSVSVLLGNGDGTFRPAVNFATDSFAPAAVIAGDFNGDGRVDLVVAYADSIPSVISVLLGNGDGTFQTPVDTPVGSASLSLAAGDFNGDGKLDLAVATRNDTCSSAISVLLGNGDGTFQSPVLYGTGAGPYGVIAGDFNGDGKLDLATANGCANTVSILFGKGDGTFPSHADYATGVKPFALVAGDFSGDGKLDLATANLGNTLSILLGNGDGTFRPHADVVAGPEPVSVAAGDFDGDGRLDLAAANSTGNAVQIFLQVSAVSLSSPSLAFPDQLVGTTSPARVITLTNSSSSALNISRIVARGDFAQSNTCGTSLAPAARCAIRVSFAPGGMGRHTGFLAITDAAVDSPQGVSLAGTGTTPPAVTLSSTVLSFAAQMLNAASSPQNLTLTNTGTGLLKLSAVATSGDFLQTNTCGGGLPSGSSCTISVRFTPATAGTRTGVLTVTDNAEDSPQTVSLSGAALLPGGQGTPENPRLPVGDKLSSSAQGTSQSGTTQISGDGQTVSDGVATAGSAVVTSATINFTQADVGKVFWIVNPTTNSVVPTAAGSVATIASVQSSTQATLNSPIVSGGTLSGLNFILGTDSTASIRAAVNAALPVNGAVYLPSGQYVVTGQIFNTSGSPNTVSLRGAGMDQTIILPSPNLPYTVGVGALINANTNANFSDFTIDFKGIPLSVVNMTPFQSGGVSSVSNVKIAGWNASAGAGNEVFNQLSDNWFGVNFVITGPDPTGMLIHSLNNVCIRCNVAGLDAAVNISDGSNIFFFGSRLLGAGNGSAVIASGASGIGSNNWFVASQLVGGSNAATVLTSTKEQANFVGCSIGPQPGTTNGTGITNVAGQTVYLVNDIITSTGTGVGINNAGTIIDGGGNSISGVTGVLPIGGNFTSGWADAGTAFINLGTPANGTFRYCVDCAIANPCASGGTGALAKRLNSAWVCN